MGQKLDPTIADLLEGELRARRYTPKSPLLKQLYSERQESERRTETRHGIWAAVVINIIYWPLDLILIPDVAPMLAGVRLLVGALTVLAVEAFYRTGAKADYIDALCAFALVVGYTSWLTVTLGSAASQSVSYYVVFGTIYMMGANLFFNFPLRIATTASLTVLFISWSMLTTRLDMPLFYHIAMGGFHVSCFGFVVYVNWKLNVERYAVFLNALSAEIQQNEVVERGRALLELSKTDPLTGLANRRAIDIDLRRLWDGYEIDGQHFAVILIDIDFFKKYNDHYGHQKGDRALMLVADALRALAEHHDALIGRYGGEEFVLLARVEAPDRALEIGREVRATVEGMNQLHPQRKDGETVVTVSVGVSYTRQSVGMTLDRLIGEADRALYSAKANGRNCVRVFDPNDPLSNDESQNVAALLRIALERDLVSLVYQPVENTRTGEIEAVEALMRLKMLDGTPVSPAVFIPIAERTGAIHELGRWALRAACLEIAARREVPVVSVNVSAVQLRAPGFAASVAGILGEAGITGDRLALEITEGSDIGTHSDVLRTIHDLRQLRVRIWLDDFGTGFAGLSWLRSIAFDTVKIDKSFLHACTMPDGMMMLRDIITLVRNRGHRVLVEGVETSEHFDILRELEIELAQGYYLARPMPAEMLREHVRAGQRDIPGGQDRGCVP